MKTKIIILAQLSLSALFISAATTASLNDGRLALPYSVEQVRHSLAISAHHETTRHIDSVRAEQDSADKNLKLRADIAGALEVSDQQINWIVSHRGKVLETLQGNVQALKLPTGSYQVKLGIGEYISEKTVSVNSGQQVQPYFRAEIASLQLRSNQVVDWLLTGSDNRSYRANAKLRLHQLLPADRYTVQAVLGDFPLQKEVHLRPGQSMKATIDIPVGRVKLIATRDKQPLFKPVTWEVFRLGRNQRQSVGKYHQHTQSISMPPGQYEAVARSENVIEKRQFWVREGSENNVILALD